MDQPVVITGYSKHDLRSFGVPYQYLAMGHCERHAIPDFHQAPGRPTDAKHRAYLGYAVQRLVSGLSAGGLHGPTQWPPSLLQAMLVPQTLPYPNRQRQVSYCCLLGVFRALAEPAIVEASTNIITTGQVVRIPSSIAAANSDSALRLSLSKTQRVRTTFVVKVTPGGQSLAI